MKSALKISLILITLAITLALAFMALNLPIMSSFGVVFSGAFGGELGWSRTLTKSIPLILVGIGMCIAWKSGSYNVGGEGQFLIGGIFAITVVTAGKGLDHSLQLPLALIMGTMGGCIYAGLAAVLMVYRGVNIVISTILLNFIAIYILQWLVSGPLQEISGKLPQTDALAPHAMLPKFSPQYDLHYGIFIAIAAAILMQTYLAKKQGGFYLRLVGSSPGAVRSIGLDGDMLKLKAMMISGAFCGLAAAVELTGITGKVDAGFSQNWGFQGIPVALVAGLHPILCIPAGVGFGALYSGTQSLSRLSVGGDTLIYILQAVAVLATVSMPKFLDKYSQKSQSKKQKEAKNESD